MKRTVTDMLGNEVELTYPPRRIVSLVPSQTELLYDLGLRDEVVGITKFCVHPDEWFRSKTRIGGTKKVHIDKVLELEPDLIIANKEENEKDQVVALAAHCPVWVGDIHTVEDSLNMIQQVGVLVDREEAANSMANDIASGFAAIQAATKVKRVAYFIWRNPWMSIGSDTFINDIIETIGWQNVLANQKRYPEIQLNVLIKYDPELILLSSEPYPFKEQHIAEIKAVLPDAEVILVDGEMFSWYGSRLLKAIPYLETLVKKH